MGLFRWKVVHCGLLWASLLLSTGLLITDNSCQLLLIRPFWLHMLLNGQSFRHFAQKVINGWLLFKSSYIHVASCGYCIVILSTVACINYSVFIVYLHSTITVLIKAAQCKEITMQQLVCYCLYCFTLSQQPVSHICTNLNSFFLCCAWHVTEDKT